MRKKFRSRDIFDDEETKEKSPIIPIIIFISIVIILCVVVFFVLSLVEEHTDIDIPIISSSNKNSSKKPSSSRDQMDLVAPTVSKTLGSTNVMDAEIKITDVKADSGGFLVGISLKTIVNKYTTISVKQINVDGFYFTTTFELSDPLDYSSEGFAFPGEDQTPTVYYFKLKKTELDDLDMFGFNNIKLIYDIENDERRQTNREFFVEFNNDLNIVNKRNGLIRIDEKCEVVVSYYKTVAAADGTYIYFDFVNKSTYDDIEVYVKELYINNKIYDMSEFSGISNRNSQKALYLFVPSKDVERVNTMQVKFFLVKEDSTTNEKSFYITNEYMRAY